MKRAFIVPAILIVATFMVLAIGLLTRQPLRNQAAFQNHYQQQARQMALAGLEEERLRLAGDVEHTYGNTTLSRALDDTFGNPVGSYIVTLDASWSTSPFHVLRVESEGFFGPATRPLARYVIRATVDIRPAPNPDFLAVVRWQESVP